MNIYLIQATSIFKILCDSTDDESIPGTKFLHTYNVSIDLQSRHTVSNLYPRMPRLWAPYTV